MPAFKASEAIEPLSYDFRPHNDAQGEVPEPSSDRVAAFYAGLAGNLKMGLGDERVAGYDLLKPEDIGRLFSSLTADEHQKLYDAMADLHAAVCDNHPGRDVLDALPFRLRQAWYAYVQEWLRPEAGKPATTR